MTETRPPLHPKIYHILHVDRLASVIAAGCLWCDSVMAAKRLPGPMIGIGAIKQRRLGLPVGCHPGSAVGDYVPFYLCPRSVMLYVIHGGNQPDLSFQGGQEGIVHLQADLHAAVQWAGAHGRRWAFSLSNAGAVYARFRADLDQLRELDWGAIEATDFRSEEAKEGKQAEFLMEHSFPWTLIEKIGVYSAEWDGRWRKRFRERITVPALTSNRRGIIKKRSPMP